MFHAWRGETHACFMHGGGRLMHASCMDGRTMHASCMEGGDSCMHQAWKGEPCMFHGWNGRRVHVSCMIHAWYMHPCMKYVETCMFQVQNFQQGLNTNWGEKNRRPKYKSWKQAGKMLEWMRCWSQVVGHDIETFLYHGWQLRVVNCNFQVK